MSVPFGFRRAVPTLATQDESGVSLTGTNRRRRFGSLASALGTPKLSAVMALLFVSLSIPILVFILVYNYSRSSAATVEMLHEQVAKTRR
jgi:hypothetical protein